MDVLLDWKPIICQDCDSCVCSTLVEYRTQGSTIWVKPLSPENPTQEGEYILSGIQPNIHYQARLTFIGPRCNQKSTTISLYYPLSQCCMTGYTLSPDGSYCYKVDEIAATPPVSSGINYIAAQNTSYSTCGTYIYEIGWNVNGTGASTKIPVIGGSTLWTNGAGACVDSTINLGPLNRTGVWIPATSPTSNDNMDLGFGVCIDLGATKTYYMAIAADNYGSIKVDGVTILQQDPSALAAQYGVGLGATFKVWHVYPVILNAGPHIIEMTGHNVTGPAGMGCEIYDASAAELSAMTDISQLTPRTVFSSSSEIGEPVQIGGVAGYTCPTNYTLASCGGTPTCKRIFQSAPINC